MAARAGHGLKAGRTFSGRQGSKRNTLVGKTIDSSGSPFDQPLMEPELREALREARSVKRISEVSRSVSSSTFLSEISTRSHVSNRFSARTSTMTDFAMERAESVLGVAVIDPFHRNKVRWDMGVAALIIYSVVKVPFWIGFQVETLDRLPGRDAVAQIDIVVDCLFGIDILLTFFTGYLDERNRLIKNHKRIALRYFRGFFVVDVVSTFPITPALKILFPEGDNSSGDNLKLSRILRLTRLFKLARLFRLNKLTAMLEEMDFLTLHHLQLLKVIGVVIFLIHMLSCACYWIATPVCPDGTPEPCISPPLPEERSWTNWARMFSLDQMDLGARYIATVHFVTATVMAVGYGELYPANAMNVFSRY
jgi:hypothetical protein